VREYFIDVFIYVNESVVVSSVDERLKQTG